jgi:hypothetical protein
MLCLISDHVLHHLVKIQDNSMTLVHIVNPNGAIITLLGKLSDMKINFTCTYSPDKLHVVGQLHFNLPREVNWVY